jgi:2-polyprenyl-3-methyl-5-hydroxy-6-metoxy-1,4-benzoquinol methylase
MSMREYYDDYWKPETSGVQNTPALRRWTAQRRSSLLKALEPLNAGSLILDAGCGLGEFSALMAERGFRVIGVDIAHKPLLRANILGSKNLSGFSVASVEGTLPFTDESFAAVWSTEVIEHLMNVQATFQEFQRVLTPGGLLILTTPFHGVVKNILLSLRGYERHYDPTGPHIRFYTRKSLQMLLAPSGFEMLKAAGIGRFYPLSMSHFVVARKKTK